MLYISDNNTGARAVVDVGDIAATIRPWFPEAPAEVYDAIDHLQDKLQREQDSSGWESYLDVFVETVPDGPRVEFSDPAQAAYIDDTVSVPVDLVGAVVVLSSAALDELAALGPHVDGHYDGQHVWVGGTAYPVAGYAWEIVASDRHGYGHQPVWCNGVPGTRDEAIADARGRYGKATGLDADDIEITLL